MPRSILLLLLALAVVLPLAQGVLYWVGKLLLAMDDIAGEALIGRLILACGAVWLVDLVVLVLAIAVQLIDQADGSS